MSKIEKLRPDEGVRLDPECLVALYAELGTQAAEEAICGAMEDMAVHISTMSIAHERGAKDRLLSAAAELTRVAHHVGMSALARVAQDVATCCENKDPVGLAATLNRLIRIGDRSLTAIWDSEDMG